MALTASAQVHDGPCVVTVPSSCLLRQPETAELSIADCSSSCGVGGPFSVKAVVKKGPSRPPN
eukprot:2123268-Alexandrium_andersonii.AAC.1